MPANTPRGFPYPLPTEPVAEGAQAIRNLAEAIDVAGMQKLGEQVITTPTFIEFAAIPQTYSHLLCVGSYRANAATMPLMYFRINGISGAGYTWANMGLTNATPANAFSGSATALGWFPMPGAGAAAGNFGSFLIVLPNYAAATMHSVLWASFGGVANQELRLGGGLVTAGTNIASIRILHDGDGAAAAAAGSKVSLYGLD